MSVIRKVVYDEGNGIRTIRGHVKFLDDTFLEIQTDSGKLTLNKKIVIAIKEVNAENGY